MEDLINQKKLKELVEKIDELLDKENLSIAEEQYLFQDMLNRFEWITQEERFDKLIKKLKKN